MFSHEDDTLCFDARSSITDARAHGRRQLDQLLKPKGSIFQRLGDLAGMSLRDVRNDTKTRPFCGPTAVASISGQPISLVKDAFRQARFGSTWIHHARAPVISGTSGLEVKIALALLGYVGQWHKIHDRPTFAHFLDTRKGAMRTHPCIVQVSNHWVAISNWQFCDTFTKGIVVEADEAPWRRARVHRVFVVTARVSTYASVTRRVRRL